MCILENITSFRIDMFHHRIKVIVMICSYTFAMHLQLVPGKEGTVQGSELGQFLKILMYECNVGHFTNMI